MKTQKKTQLRKHRIYGYGNVCKCKHNEKGYCTWYGEYCQNIPHDIHETCRAEQHLISKGENKEW